MLTGISIIGSKKMTQEDIIKLCENIVKLRKDIMKLCIAAIILFAAIAILIASSFNNISTMGSVAKATNNTPAIYSNSSIGITASAEVTPTTSSSTVGFTATAEKTE